MSALSGDQERQIKDLVCEHLELEPGRLSDDGSFTEDYGADSLSLIDIAAAIEKTFDVAIKQEDLPQMVNLAAVYQMAAKYLVG